MTKLRDYNGKERAVRFFKKQRRGEQISEEEVILNGIHRYDAVGKLKRP